MHTVPLLLIVIVAMSACSLPDPISGCHDQPGMHPVCGFQNPEDLALLPDEHTLIVSQFGNMDGSQPGNLALFDTRSEALQIVFPAVGDSAPPRVDDPLAPEGWGDTNCPEPPTRDFSPHGLDLAARPDGRLMLTVINHGGRESVEIFEVTREGAVYDLVWRGCIIPPEDAYLNDIVILPDGGLLVTHMMDRDFVIWGMLKASLGYDTGFVYEWQPNAGMRVLPGSEGPFPNGIEISPDGSEVYLNLYLPGTVRRIARSSGKVLASVALPHPDNSSWARDGRLLVASHVGPFEEQIRCNNLDSGACPLAFEIQALDPVTLRSEKIFANAGAPMGGGTVAIDLGGELVIGSFAGDRVLFVRPARPQPGPSPEANKPPEVRAE